MDRIDFAKFLESTGTEVQARIERVAHYKQPTGVGDAREDVLREYLREVLPERFSVDRGKIFDSRGRLSREFDVIIAERSYVVPMMALAGRRVVPVEAVYGVIEIKSYLNPDNYNNFINAVIELDEMRRFYHPMYKFLGVPQQEEGFDVQDSRIGGIWSGIITFDAPQGVTLSSYLQKFCEGLIFICIPNRELVLYSANPKGFVSAALQLNSLPYTIWLIMDLVTSNPRPRFLMPDFGRYRSAIVKELGEVQSTRQIYEENSQTDKIK